MSQPFTPIHIDTSEEVEEKREPFFYIDEVEYTIPVKVPANVVVQYFKDVKEKGAEYAVACAMEDMLGEDAMTALAETDEITDEQMQKIMAVIETKLLGTMKKVSGKSRAARRQRVG